MSSTRKAYKAGSWYDDDCKQLEKSLNTWLIHNKSSEKMLKAIISPHAGYYYSGQTSGYGFSQIDISKYDNIFILGPSHTIYTDSCHITKYKKYETPLGNLKINTKINNELYNTDEFSYMPYNSDEDEHSIEMQLPYLAHLMNEQKCHIPIIPILVGSISSNDMDNYINILLPYFINPKNLFIISSDFCHWGQRFGYTYIDNDNKNLTIYQCIEKLDKKAISCIINTNYDLWLTYLKKTKNTICGRYPISILLRLLNEIDNDVQVKNLYYTQSDSIISKNQSSVSYASIGVWID